MSSADLLTSYHEVARRLRVTKDELVSMFKAGLFPREAYILVPDVNDSLFPMFNACWLKKFTSRLYEETARQNLTNITHLNRKSRLEVLLKMAKSNLPVLTRADAFTMTDLGRYLGTHYSEISRNLKSIDKRYYRHVLIASPAGVTVDGYDFDKSWAAYVKQQLDKLRKAGAKFCLKQALGFSLPKNAETGQPSVHKEYKLKTDPIGISRPAPPQPEPAIPVPLSSIPIFDGSMYNGSFHWYELIGDLGTNHRCCVVRTSVGLKFSVERGDLQDVKGNQVWALVTDQAVAREVLLKNLPALMKSVTTKMQALDDHFRSLEKQVAALDEKLKQAEDALAAKEHELEEALKPKNPPPQDDSHHEDDARVCVYDGPPVPSRFPEGQ